VVEQSASARPAVAEVLLSVLLLCVAASFGGLDHVIASGEDVNILQWLNNPADLLHVLLLLLCAAAGFGGLDHVIASGEDVHPAVAKQSC
jgi:hypothetical protein